MAPRDWRDPADYADLARLDLASLAWEFLRRNPQYRAEQAARTEDSGDGPAAAARWGLRFPVPPDASADEGPVFWRADVAPAHVVLLGRSVQGGVTGEALAGRCLARRPAGEGLHLRFPDGLQAVIPAAVGLRVPLAAEAALDADLAARLTALGALERLLGGRPPGPDPLPPLSRRRAGLMLRALDARTDGASYRDVAAQVLGQPPGEPRAWRTAAARDVAIRLCRSAWRMAGGGYRALLRRRR